MQKKELSVTSPPYRPGTRLPLSPLAFIFNAGGIGDYIHYTTAIRYAIKKGTHLYGKIVSPSYFADLAHLWFDDYDPRFTVHVSDAPDFTAIGREIGDMPVFGPGREQLVNACNHHLFSLGFYYYAQEDKIPSEWKILPEIRGDEADLSSFNLPEKYVVLTPNATADNRRMTAECFNGLIKHFLSEGTPVVILGKNNVTVNYFSVANKGIDLTGTIDLREKTSLRQAACIMARSKLVLGMDSGLLHLAACSDVPIVWIFTSVDPRLRIPPRKVGSVNTVITPPDNFSCRFCNTNMKYVVGFDFKNCIYGDNECVKMLKADYIISVLNEIKDKIK